jgi:hypothetical protein
MIIKYNEYINEYWDWKNIFRNQNNPNVISDELFNYIKIDIKNNIDILTTVVEIDDGFLEMILSNKSKLKIILTYDNDEPVEGIIILKQFRKKEENKLIVEYKKAKYYYDYIIKKCEKYKNKAIIYKNAKNIRKIIN